MQRKYLSVLKFIIAIIVIAWLNTCSLPGTAYAEAFTKIAYSEAFTNQISERLQNRIQAVATAAEEQNVQSSLDTPRLLVSFYGKRNYQPAWIDGYGPLPYVEDFIEIIRKADRDGLKPDDYYLAAIETAFAEVLNDTSDHDKLLDLDLLLTSSFFAYSSHVSTGRVNSKQIDATCLINRRKVDLTQTLQTALDSNCLRETLQCLHPPHPAYLRLQQSLNLYLDLASQGGWPLVPQGQNMQKGYRGRRVQALRARLAAEDNLEKGYHNMATDYSSDNDKNNLRNNLFDKNLEPAVRKFQKRHGLRVDGAVGHRTLAALNIPTIERAHQIALNMERWRWLPEDFGQRYIIINIADFDLKVIENDLTMIVMRIVVGDPYEWSTPVFSGRMTYLVLNPYWYVPSNMAIKEMLPLIQNNPSYLAERGIKVFQNRKGKLKEIDPNTIDWPRVENKNFPYRFRQEPGLKNPLGRVKFIFPNRYSVILHDTPARALFTKAVRGFSHGCIRIEKPIELAEYLLRDDPRWTRENILSFIDKGKEQAVQLHEPIPIYVLYWTAWADEHGTVQFRRDFYGRDQSLDKAIGLR